MPTSRTPRKRSVLDSRSPSPQRKYHKSSSSSKSSTKRKSHTTRKPKTKKTTKINMDIDSDLDIDTVITTTKTTKSKTFTSRKLTLSAPKKPIIRPPRTLKHYVESQTKKVTRINLECTSVYKSTSKDKLNYMWMRVFKRTAIICSDAPYHYNSAICKSQSFLLQEFPLRDFFFYYYISMYEHLILENPHASYPTPSSYHYPNLLPENACVFYDIYNLYDLYLHHSHYSPTTATATDDNDDPPLPYLKIYSTVRYYSYMLYFEYLFTYYPTFISYLFLKLFLIVFLLKISLFNRLFISNHSSSLPPLPIIPLLNYYYSPLSSLHRLLSTNTIFTITILTGSSNNSINNTTLTSSNDYEFLYPPLTDSDMDVEIQFTDTDIDLLTRSLQFDNTLPGISENDNKILTTFSSIIWSL